MTFETVGALALVGGVCVVVAVWGMWLSHGSATNGAEWGYAALNSWKPMPWIIAALGLFLLVLAEPIWIGVAVLYVAAMTGILTRSVRRRMEAVRRVYGGFDDLPKRT